MKMLYLRDIQKHVMTTANGETIEVDFNKFSLIERLYYSTIMTAYSLNSKKTFGQIIFNESNDHSLSIGDYSSFDKMVTKYTLIRPEVICWIKENFKIHKENKGAERFSIYATEIETNDIFVIRNGNDGKKLPQIAFKAFVLAAAKSKQTKNKALKEVCLYSYINGDIDFSDIKEEEYTEVKKLKKRRAHIKQSINKWMDEVGVAGHYDDDYLIIDGKATKEDSIEIVPTKEEIKALPKEVKDDLIYNHHKDIDYAAKQIARQVQTFEVAEEDPAYHWQQRYQALKEANKKMWPQIIMKINDVFDFNKEISKIAEDLGTNRQVIVRFLDTNGVDSKDGGVQMKNELRKSLLKLRDHVECLHSDYSWMPNGNKLYGDIVMGYAYVCFPKLMNIK